MTNPAATVRSLAKLRLCGAAIVSIIALELFPVLLSAQQPQLIPQPREMQATGQNFQVKPETQIVLSTNAAAEDRFAAESLQEELRTVTGHEYAIVSSPSAPRGPAIRLARFGDASVQGAQTGDVGDQGYVLNVDASGIVVAGKDSAGLFYGVQTLRQLVVADGDSAKAWECACATGLRLRTAGPRWTWRAARCPN